VPEIALKAGEKRMVVIPAAAVDKALASAASFWLDGDFRGAASVMLRDLP